MSEFRDESSDRRSDEISLQPMLQVLWSYRQVVLLALVTAAVAYAAVMLVVYVTTPKETVASLDFQLTFDGADRGRYPNGTRFSPSDIVSTPVVAEVLRKNELERYLTLHDLKDALFVLEANPDVELLAYEYRSKLSDTRLSAVDRSRIEEEFRKKQESLKSAAFSLNYRRGQRVLHVPSELLAKVLGDTLSVWAQQAGERRGVARYDIPIVSKGALRQEILSAEEDVVAVDILRNALDRLRGSIARIAELPGAAAVRIEKSTVSLADIKARVDDVLSFRVEPLLIAAAATQGVRAQRYFGDRALSVRVMREEVQKRLTALQDALQAYQRRGSGQPDSAVLDGGAAGRVTPQLTESFIDRLVELTTQPEDIEFRQELTDRTIAEGVMMAELSRQQQYYEGLLKTPHVGTSLLSTEIERRRTAAFDEAARLMDQLDALYAQITEQNLNPSSTLYTTTLPFTVRTTSALGWRTVLLYFVVTLFAAAIIAPLACLLHDYIRRRIAAPPGGASAPAVGTGSPHVVTSSETAPQTLAAPPR